MRFDRVQHHGPSFTDDDQAQLPAAIVLENTCKRPGGISQGRLGEFAEVDSAARQLHFMVFPAHEFNISVFIELAHIAGPVISDSAAGYNDFGGLFWFAQITSHYLGTTDPK